MSCCDLHLTVQEEDPITLEMVEETIKPEQDKTVTPTYSEQIVLPDAGMTLGSVTVEPIPDPTERMSITENGTYDVARIGTADVDVLPTLQKRTVEPKEYGQTIRADSSYDGLEQVDVLRIPEWYVVPQGAVEVTANGSYDVTEKKTVNVSVPIPVMPDEYPVGGSVADKSETGYYVRRGQTEIISSAFYQSHALQWIDLPDSITTIGQQAFADCTSLTLSELPASLDKLENYVFFACSSLTSMHFKRKPTSVASGVFVGCGNLKDIYVPWSEGEVANAPWGATKATIHYNWEG